MLRILRIENIAVAREVELELGRGFSVLTGETGAGKSILIDGLTLVLGGRISKDMIRPGEKNASVTAIFSGVENILPVLDDLGIHPDGEGEITVRRVFSEDGKSSTKINGKNASVSDLRELSSLLININGQNDTHTALDQSTHIELLDEYSVLDRSAYSEFYREYLDAVQELKEIKESLRDRSMMTDILKYQIKEIDAAKLSNPDEEEKLEKLRIKLKDIEKISKYTGIVVRALSQSEKGVTAAYMLEKAQAALEQLGGVMENAQELADKLESMRYEIIDIAEQTSDLIDSDMQNPEEKLDHVEKRLSLISRLEKKYGADISEILSFREEAAQKLDALESGDLAVREAETALAKAYEAALAEAKRLSGIRSENAKILSDQVGVSLKYLDMPKARFEVKVSRDYSSDGKEILNPNGCDSVCFMFTANPGYPMKELSKVASGGELSRTVLAIKCALAGKHGVDTVIFDEIDTGVSGATSQKIGMKLRELSKHIQVICVTHSPQVASLADAHFFIHKSEKDGKAESFVRLLTDEERISEIARIIGGVTVTDKQIQAAREMLDTNKD